jgi:AcrR family transcriptional regulator
LDDQMTTVDHRRAVADRNRAAILDAVERLLSDRQPLTMAGLATAAGVSRPTLYAHFKTLAEVVEATAEKLVLESVSAIEAAQPEEGPADEAITRMIEASWDRLGGMEALLRGGAEYLPAGHLDRTHAPIMVLTFGVIERGQRDGTFRTDLPAVWLVRAYYTLIHAADEMARSSSGPNRKQSLAVLKTSVLDLLRGPR